MAVSAADVLKVADLARLHVDEAQLDTLVTQLNGILAHMDVLNRVDTSAISPMVGGILGSAGMRLREDVVAPVPLNVPAPALAAESRDRFICVPRLATHEDLS
jgi:aspartyl-tRNA(Asn)/glutamyl-tRNA(Gln) amidotransferase subunit C